MTATWPLVALGDVCDLLRGVSFDKSEARRTTAGGHVPILRAGNIRDHLELDEDLIWVPDVYVSNGQRLRVGDVVVCLSSGSPAVVGKAASLEHSWSGSVGAFCGIVRARDPELAPYLALWFRSSQYVAWRDRQARGVNIQNLRFSELAKVLVPLPPVADRQTIVRALRQQLAAVAQARAAADAQLEACDALMPAAMRGVFGGALDALWTTRRVAEVCEIQLGKMLSPKSKTGARPRQYLRNANVQWNRFDVEDVAAMDFTETEEQKFALRRGDLLVCEGGEPGRCAVWQGQIEPCCFQKAVHRLRPRDGAIDPYFMMYRLWYGALIGEFLGAHTRTTIAHLPAVRLAELPVRVPSIAQQQAIVERLNSKVDEIARLRASVAVQVTDVAALPAALLRRVFDDQL